MRVAPLLLARGREIERLFAATASAFGAPLPAAASRRPSRWLREYARFTSDRARELLGLPERRRAAEQRLFRAAFALGARFRLRLRVRSRAEAMRAARLLYRGLGIDFRGRADGTVVIRRCLFAATYTGEVCRVMSALDRGLLAGLAFYGDLRFSRRITEGASACTACFVRSAG